MVIYNDDEVCLRRYRTLETIRPELFDNPADCPTKILLDSVQVRQAQDHARAKRSAEGQPTSDLRVGLLAEDHYIGYIIRDAVKFSDGSLGLYNRVVATGGVVVLPILDDAIALIHIFRHAPRRWFLEAPQGLALSGTDPIEEARRELLEEMGAVATELYSLGKVFTSTGMTSESLSVVAARISKIGSPQLSEGIDSIRTIAKRNIDPLLLDGSICDGPTTTAIARANARGLL